MRIKLLSELKSTLLGNSMYTNCIRIVYVYDALAEELAAYDGRTPLLVQLKFMPSSIQKRGHLKVITECSSVLVAYEV